VSAAAAGDGDLAPAASRAGGAATMDGHTVTVMDEVVAGTISSDSQIVVFEAGREVTFGRAPTVQVRIGHAPVYDDVVPKLAGKVFAHDDHVVVANLHDTLALDIRVPGRPLVSVAPRAWHAPGERSFDVLVTGTYTYELAVTVNTAQVRTRIVPADTRTTPQPPTGARPRLSERQRSILDAYVAPLESGAPPASHQQVAATLGISRSLVRLECHRIWSELLVAGVPMRALGDARDEVADAWARHRF
jgi:hypothetical protein